MKKVLMSLMIIFCLSLIGMSAFFIAGCETVAEVGAGGNEQTPEEETPPDTTDDPPAEVKSNKFYLNVTAITFDGPTPVETSDIANPNYFTFRWTDENAKVQDFGVTIKNQCTAAYGKSLSTSKGVVENVYKVNYSYSNGISSVRRMGQIYPYVYSTSYSYFGVSDSKDNANCTTVQTKTWHWF